MQLATGGRSPTQQRQPRLHGRYVSAPSPSAAQVLRSAAELAALAGPGVDYRGPQILGRERHHPNHRVLFGVFGTSRHPWWRWRQWLTARRRAAREAAGEAGPRGAADRGQLRPQAVARASERARPLTALTMDDSALDLDELDEGITADMLAGCVAVCVGGGGGLFSNLIEFCVCRPCDCDMGPGAGPALAT